MLLIERAQLRLTDGLNVLTGETGAGKTVLAHALDLLLGGRPRGGIVRPGAGEAYVEGSFRVPAEMLGRLPEGCAIEEEEARQGGAAAADGEGAAADGEGAVADGGAATVEIVLGRRVSADGRTRAYLNGRTATVADLRAIGAQLISFYGQHEHRKLTVSSAQLEILDRFCGPQQAQRKAACAAALAEMRGAKAELARLAELQGARERELDLLEYELGEIEQLEPAPGEHEKLSEQRERLRQLDALRATAAAALEALAGDEQEQPGAARLSADAAARIDALQGVDARLDALGGRCRSLALELEDLSGELRGYGEQLDGQDGELEGLEERLSALERLMRKHGGDVEAVLAHAERSRSRRDELLGAEVAADAANERLAAAEVELAKHVAALRRARSKAAPRLAEAVREQLSALAMPDASFEVRLSEREPGPGGGDLVELMLAPNPGVAAAPLREIASGGELSRTMLALTTVGDLGDGGEASEELVTLVFDEIDAGIGGHTARAVGERLRQIATRRQVICITHLPQVASLAQRHFAIVKDTSAQPTKTEVVQLAEGELVGELMRMLGASDGDAAARRHARELLKAA
jgi:DNA repair protein RecN (Recombination protein N)